ncbi:MAG: YHS domain-containing protein [Burkholderiales bacterium]|nr:YHS domain-containing protein [Burkholderiales bacterium]
MLRRTSTRERNELRKSNLCVSPLSRVSQHDTDSGSGRRELLEGDRRVSSSGISVDASKIDLGQAQFREERHMDSGRLEKDPVCAMMVGEWEKQFVHRGIGYAFCSQQCRERFISSPELYVGRRGLLAPKQKGMEIIKRNRMPLSMPLAQAEFLKLKGALLSMMGVIAVHPSSPMAEGRPGTPGLESRSSATPRIEALEITYDLLQATAAQIERKCAELDVMPSNRWGEKLLRDFIHYMEKCELEDLQNRPAVPAGGEACSRRTATAFQRGA